MEGENSFSINSKNVSPFGQNMARDIRFSFSCFVTYCTSYNFNIKLRLLIGRFKVLWTSVFKSLRLYEKRAKLHFISDQKSSKLEEER